MPGASMRLAVLGANGRMGRLLVRSVLDAPDAELVGAVVRPGTPHVGQDASALAGGAAIGATLVDGLERLPAVDGLLDFTTPELSRAAAAWAAERGIVHVIGTTGFSAADLETLRRFADRSRVVQSGNMSLGVNVLAELVRQAARALDPDWDIEIVETHHRAKVDAPSGTALLLGEAAADGRAVDLGSHSARGRDGHTGARRTGDIGFASLRGGSVVGEHTVLFATAGERIELTHRADDRGLFARGAVRAALWARERPPGWYGMADVLGLAAVGGQ